MGKSSELQQLIAKEFRHEIHRILREIPIDDLAQIRYYACCIAGGYSYRFDRTQTIRRLLINKLMTDGPTSTKQFSQRFGIDEGEVNSIANSIAAILDKETILTLRLRCPPANPPK